MMYDSLSDVPKFGAVHFCVCGRAFSSEKEARECARSTPAARFKPGDVVTISSGYGWHDGDDEWVLFNDPKGKCADGRGGRDFIWVVVRRVPVERASPFAPNHYAHRVRWVLRTLGMRGQHFEVKEPEMDYSGQLQMIRRVSPVPRAIARKAPAMLAPKRWPQPRAGARRLPVGP